MVRVRTSAVAAAGEAAAKAGVPLIDVLSAGALALAGSILTTTPTAPAAPAGEVITVAEAKRRAKGTATR